jgi:hypothetical protein
VVAHRYNFTSSCGRIKIVDGHKDKLSTGD